MIEPYDPEFEKLLREEEAIENGTHEEFLAQIELVSEIARHHKDFLSISAYCTLVRNDRMKAEEAIKFIQNIVG